MSGRMSRARFLFFLLLVTSDVCWAQEEPREVRVDAAYTSNSFIYLVAGGELLYIDRNSKEETIHFAIYEPERLTRMQNIQAAISSKDISDLRVKFFGDTYGLSVEFTGRQRVKRLRYKKRQFKFFKNCGPDAAATKGSRAYFFKGCKMARRKRRKQWYDPERLATYGLPCNVDAAWNDGNEMVILKGNQVWIWKDDDSVDGPHLFHDIYTVTSWMLKP